MADTEQDPKPKTKRAKKVKTEQMEVTPPPAAEKPPKKPKNRVEHEGSTITLAGKDVKLRVMTPAQQTEWGIKTITGTFGVPCEQPLVIQFKSPKAAEKFFEHCLHYEEEDETLEFIDSGGRTEWHSDKLMDMMYGEG